MPATRIQRYSRLAPRLRPRCVLISLAFVSVCLSPFLAPFIIPAATAQDAVLRSNESLEALTRYERQLEELESRYNSYHPSLLEPLLAMEALLEEQGLYPRVAELQARRLQLLRTSLGFEHPDLIPVLEAMVTTEMRQQNWDEVTDHLEHIRYLQAANYGNDSPEMLEARRRQSQWLLNQVFLDSEANRANLVLDARDILDDSLDQAEKIYGDENPELVPWLYRRALSLYYVVAMMNTDSGVSGLAIDEVARRDGMGRLNSARQGRIFSPLGFGGANRIPVVEGGEPIGSAYLRQALSFLNDIEDIGEEHNDLELQAMAHLYQGDFHLLMGRGSGQRDFRDARQKLIDVGVEASRVDRFFARPMPIPMPEFFLGFDALERYQQSLYADLPEASDNSAHTGIFTAWDEDLADVALPRPPANFPSMQIDSNEVELDFRISSKGEVTAVDTIAAWPNDPDAEREVERRARRALRNMQFRPAFIDNRNRMVRDARIRYRYYVREER